MTCHPGDPADQSGDLTRAVSEEDNVYVDTCRGYHGAKDYHSPSCGEDAGPLRRSGLMPLDSEALGGGPPASRGPGGRAAFLACYPRGRDMSCLLPRTGPQCKNAKAGRPGMG